MKRNAFTLIELMIAVVVISILMSIVFRLSGIGSDTQKRNITASRLQRLENCLSGYYAAFGSYPQVPLQRYSRNFRLKVDEYGVQDPNGTGEEESTLSWRNVEAACRAQPIGTKFPFRSNMKEYIGNIAKQLQKKATSGEKHWKDLGFDNAALKNGFSIDNSNAIKNSDDTVFEFGVMSFILPRYLFMLGCDEELLDRDEWQEYNTIPADPQNGHGGGGSGGGGGGNSWGTIRSWGYESDGKVKTDGDAWKLPLVPSQAVCARWIANLEGCCSVVTGNNFFGISIGDGQPSALSADNPGVASMIRYPDPSNPGQNGYVLNSITIVDGWGREFYYYSAPPYQSYTLWSAGPNGMTFCPWIPINTLNSSEATTAGYWMADDIIQMSH